MTVTHLWPRWIKNRANRQRMKQTWSDVIDPQVPCWSRVSRTSPDRDAEPRHGITASVRRCVWSAAHSYSDAFSRPDNNLSFGSYGCRTGKTRLPRSLHRGTEPVAANRQPPSGPFGVALNWATLWQLRSCPPTTASTMKFTRFNSTHWQQ